MKSGIYCLTFKNNEKYVGRSIDIERRLVEHAEKLKKGTAAKPLQAAYNKYGYPNARVLMYCHSDHCDLMESYFICKLQPELNSVSGIAVTSSELDVLEQHVEWLQLSTVEHLNKMMQYELDISNMQKSFESDKTKLVREIRRLNSYIDQDRVAADVKNEIAALSKDNDSLREVVDELEDKLAEERSKSIWKRIFKW